MELDQIIAHAKEVKQLLRLMIDDVIAIGSGNSGMIHFTPKFVYQHRGELEFSYRYLYSDCIHVKGCVGDFEFIAVINPRDVEMYQWFTNNINELSDKECYATGT